MKQTKFLFGVVFSLAFLASCKKDANLQNPAASEDANITKTSADLAENARRGGTGHVYTMSNEAGGNKILDYRRDADGRLTFSASYTTGGNGTGAGLGSQGTVNVSADELLVVNAGSNTISSFKVTGNGLNLRSTINSGGTTPVSIARYDDIVFVLNAGGTGNIAGFKIDDGKLRPIPNSIRPLSSNASGPAEIAFVNNGNHLAITEKATNKIITYTVSEHGIPGIMHSLTSANQTPFGFAVGRNGNIFVSEAAGGGANASTVSSYHVAYDGTISLITGPVSANQTAACWVVLTDDNRYVYATNTGSASVSSFSTNFTGSLNLANAVAAPTGTTPIDAALSSNSKYLYVLNSNSHSISVYSVGNNGALSSLQTVTGLVAGDNGLAAR